MCDNCFRMTSDGSLPADKRRNYSSVFNAIARIYKVSIIVIQIKKILLSHGALLNKFHTKLTWTMQEEGLTTLWRGATPTMARWQLLWWWSQTRLSYHPFRYMLIFFIPIISWHWAGQWWWTLPSWPLTAKPSRPSSALATFRYLKLFSFIQERGRLRVYYNEDATSFGHVLKFELWLPVIDLLQDGIFCHFVASMISGLVTTIASMPVDIFITIIAVTVFTVVIIQLLHPLQILAEVDVLIPLGGYYEDATAVNEICGWGTGIQGRRGCPYEGSSWINVEHVKTVPFPMKCHFQFQVVKNEGFFSLWKGFTPYYFRLGPHTVLTFIFLEQVTHAGHIPLCANRSLFSDPFNYLVPFGSLL